MVKISGSNTILHKKPGVEEKAGPCRTWLPGPTQWKLNKQKTERTTAHQNPTESLNWIAAYPHFGRKGEHNRNRGEIHSNKRAAVHASFTTPLPFCPHSTRRHVICRLVFCCFPSLDCLVLSVPFLFLFFFILASHSFLQQLRRQVSTSHFDFDIDSTLSTLTITATHRHQRGQYDGTTLTSRPTTTSKLHHNIE